MSTEQIIYENGNYWVRKVEAGHYEVYKNGITHSTRCSIVEYSDDDKKALAIAIEECDRRNEKEN